MSNPFASRGIDRVALARALKAENMRYQRDEDAWRWDDGRVREIWLERADRVVTAYERVKSRKETP